jgi:hypothetical protein
LKRPYQKRKIIPPLTTAAPARTMTATSIREELQAMRNSFFSRKNDSTATTCAAGFACSDANTNNNSVLLLTIDTVLAVSIFVILGILGITPPTGHAKPVFAG